jgi:uncharacterized protein
MFWGLALDTKVILDRYFCGDVLQAIVAHGNAVSGLAVSISRLQGMSDDEIVFVHQASMLHDIGVCRVRAPELGLFGEHPYIMHGILGREILEAEGLPLHALICERHIGVGLTENDIIQQSLGLPLRDMSPVTLAEQIVCFADLFYSKKPGRLLKRKSVADVRASLQRFGPQKVEIFDVWMQRFGAAI